ncbi:bifunctional diguanylate cyclase/phosphodiesterase [Azoarcus sp. KH32C]|uniref:putative bifunctional diguanylate cyclase/phosphodiesterase n=1 Tax=Azoarcus sp. KH32C TaxID=748247 RepID=UPI00023868F9|nr:bifunctional diguanylate cyclase/phosphodiesterase [Azoarcus sp. KH32C]BAL23204.1 diguanylate cyclase/phosphodiesterase [Azoarcus sp. KH32C]
MNEQPRMPPKNAAEVLAAVGFGPRDVSILQAFASAVPAASFEAAFAARLDRLAPRAPSTIEAVFFGLLLERYQWGKAEWLEALAECWLDCLHAGSADTLAATAATSLLDGMRDALAGEHAPGRAEYDILSSGARLAQAIQAMLAGSAFEQLHHRLRAGDGLDPATGLPSRTRFMQLLERWLNRSEARQLGLLLLHAEWEPSGQHLLSAQRDRVRRLLSDAMRSVLRPQDILCSTADQEWALIMPDLRSVAQVQLAARRLVDICERSPEHNFPHLRGAIHVGAALAPEDGESAAAIERAARAALHRAVRADLPVVCFDPEMIAAMEHEFDLEREIVGSMGNPPFKVWLQPQVHLVTGRCAGAEALLRWRRDNGEWVPPPDIIDIASRLGLMPELTRWVMAQVVRIIADLDAAGIEISVSLNLVAQDLHEEDLPERVAHALAAWQVPPKRLVLEITEGALIGDRQRAAHIMERLRTLGCSISLDDFGTGFSSFAYMRDLPVSELKIDQLFICDMLSSPRDHAIVTAVQALASGLGMKVVAEGVEDQATADELKRIGCNLGQGFLWARAMPLEEFIPWVRERQRM